ncbi:MAG: Maf family protein [Nitrospirae bacterium]|nr:Maf family protein [Nitrospirota bacterium]
MSKGKAIILASSSPRRREILEKAGLSFSVDPCDCAEKLREGLPPRKLAKSLSLGKAASVADRHKKALIIAADTLIVFRGGILGKPHTREQARKMLRMLNGRTHLVITGFTILDTETKKRVSRSVETKVFFRKMTPSELDAYVDSGEPLDKAGAYGIQGLGSVLVKRIEGDYLNVVGLPLSVLAAELKKFGIPILRHAGRKR